MPMDSEFLWPRGRTYMENRPQPRCLRANQSTRQPLPLQRRILRQTGVTVMLTPDIPSQWWYGGFGGLPFRSSCLSASLCGFDESRQARRTGEMTIPDENRDREQWNGNESQNRGEREHGEREHGERRTGSGVRERRTGSGFNWLTKAPQPPSERNSRRSREARRSP